MLSVLRCHVPLVQMNNNARFAIGVTPPPVFPVFIYETTRVDHQAPASLVTFQMSHHYLHVSRYKCSSSGWRQTMYTSSYDVTTNAHARLWGTWRHKIEYMTSHDWIHDVTKLIIWRHVIGYMTWRQSLLFTDIIGKQIVNAGIH